MATADVQERLLTLKQAADLLPGSPHSSTLNKWVTYGLRGVKLRATRVGGRILVSESALAEFQRAVDAAREGVPA